MLVYVGIGEAVGPHHPGVNLIVFRAIALVSIVTIGIIFVVRRAIVSGAVQRLANNPADTMALQRWRGGSLATFAACEAVALYGFVLRMQGFTFSQVLPFYFGGFLLMLYFGPWKAVSNDLGASASAGE
jgi:hypothetical protein